MLTTNVLLPGVEGSSTCFHSRHIHHPLSREGLSSWGRMELTTRPVFLYAPYTSWPLKPYARTRVMVHSVSQDRSLGTWPVRVRMQRWPSSDESRGRTCRRPSTTAYATRGAGCQNH